MHKSDFAAFADEIRKQDKPPAFRFVTLDTVPELEVEWLIPGWVPRGGLALLVADGGIGKTSVWCNIAAAISAGKPCILDPPGYSRPPETVLFLSGEDSPSHVLRKKLRLAGANMANIILPDLGELNKIKFGTDFSQSVREIRPTLCIVDPLQGFLPPEVNMSSRNDMRNTLQPLADLGDETGTTFLIVCHTNKRLNASGRDRVSDSSDLWDIARSVMMMGFTEDGATRYLSHEKCNYSAKAETILLTVDEGGMVHKTGTSPKRDADFQRSKGFANKQRAQTLEECMQWAFNEVAMANGQMDSKELDERLEQAGYSKNIIRDARKALNAEGSFGTRRDVIGPGRNNRKFVTYIKPTTPTPMQDLPDDTPVPFL